MIQCPRCTAPIREGARSCPACGMEPGAAVPPSHQPAGAPEESLDATLVMPPPPQREPDATPKSAGGDALVVSRRFALSVAAVAVVAALAMVVFAYQVVNQPIRSKTGAGVLAAAPPVQTPVANAVPEPPGLPESRPPTAPPREAQDASLPPVEKQSAARRTPPSPAVHVARAGQPQRGEGNFFERTYRAESKRWKRCEGRWGSSPECPTFSQ